MGQGWAYTRQWVAVTRAERGGGLVPGDSKAALFLTSRRSLRRLGAADPVPPASPNGHTRACNRRSTRKVAAAAPLSVKSVH